MHVAGRPAPVKQHWPTPTRHAVQPNRPPHTHTLMIMPFCCTAPSVPCPQLQLHVSDGHDNRSPEHGLVSGGEGGCRLCGPSATLQLAGLGPVAPLQPVGCQARDDTRWRMPALGPPSVIPWSIWSALTPTSSLAYRWHGCTLRCRVTASTRRSAGGQVKITGTVTIIPDTFDVGGFVETKFMHNWADSTTEANMTSYQARQYGTVKMLTQADGAPGNCSIITVGLNRAEAIATVREYLEWPADTQVPIKVSW